MDFSFFALSWFISNTDGNSSTFARRHCERLFFVGWCFSHIYRINIGSLILLNDSTCGHGTCSYVPFRELFLLAHVGCTCQTWMVYAESLPHAESKLFDSFTWSVHLCFNVLPGCERFVAECSDMVSSAEQVMNFQLWCSVTKTIPYFRT